MSEREDVLYQEALGEVERLTKLVSKLESRLEQGAANYRNTETARRAAVEEVERFESYVAAVRAIGEIIQDAALTQQRGEDYGRLCINSGPGDEEDLQVLLFLCANLVAAEKARTE